MKKNHTIACWLTSPRRHKHLHCDLWEESAPEVEKCTGEFETFSRFTVSSVWSGWRDAAAEIFLQHLSRQWNESTQAERLKDCSGVQRIVCVVQRLGISEAPQRKKNSKVFILFKITCCLISSNTSIRRLCTIGWIKRPFHIYSHYASSFFQDLFFLLVTGIFLKTRLHKYQENQPWSETVFCIQVK